MVNSYWNRQLCQALALVGNWRREQAWQHLPEAAAIAAIGELFREGRQVVASSSTRRSSNVDAEGKNLHVTVRPAQWWLTVPAKRGKITAQKIGRDYLSRSVAE